MRPIRMLTAAACALVVGLPAETAVADAAPAGGADRTLRGYTADTWRSMAAMVSPTTGLPSDNVGGDLTGRGAYTSPTNIGAYLWSTVAARDTGLISRNEAYQRIRKALASIGRLPHHTPSGQYYNWYDPDTLAVLLTFPDSGDPIKPFLSSVDNGWLATGLRIARAAEPRLSRAADAILSTMDFGFYYDPAANPDAGTGQIRGGFWDADPGGCTVVGNYRGRGPDVWYTCHHYGALNTEPRIASYLGIAAGQIPPEHYYGTWRTFPDTCDWSWQEQKPVGGWQTYRGVRVFEGGYRYRGISYVPTWGGSMFEALMVPLFVPEETWAPKAWGATHPNYVRAQIAHGLADAKYGYWGFSPANNPDGGYREYGVDLLGMDGPGYTSDQERTSVDVGFAGCRDAQPLPASYGRGVVTPHASFLALRYAPRESLANLAKLRAHFDAYGPGGFYDSVDVTTGTVSKRYLALDQGMVMAALGNALTGDRIRRYLSGGQVERVLRPVMAPERFAVRRVG